MVILTKELVFNLIKSDNELRNYFGNVQKIEIISDCENVVYLILGNKNKGIAKIGYRGWSEIEYKNHEKLYNLNYPVAKPIKYIPIEGNILDNWSFGDINRNLGVLFCDYIEGYEISRNANKELIIQAIKLLKKIHQDERLREEPIKDYQDIEVDRGKSYLPVLDSSLREKISSDLEIYRELPVTLTFIHGGARLEHFLHTPNGIYVIDLEASSIGDPFKDLMYFFIDLYMNDLFSKDFFNIYFERYPTPDEIERLNFFVIRQLLIKAKYGKTPMIKKRVIDYLKLDKPIKMFGVY